MFLQKILSHGRRPASVRTPSDRTRRRAEGEGRDEENTTCGKTHEEMADERHMRHLSSQIHRIAGEGYSRGLAFLEAGRCDEARERLEAALAARLVLHGPDSRSVLEVHDKLSRVARLQGDTKKAAHHKAKVAIIHSTLMLQRIQHDNAHDSVDWSVLCE